MKMITVSEAAAQQSADDFYERLKISDPVYAANMERWDVAHQDEQGRWFMNVDSGVMPVMLTAEKMLVSELRAELVIEGVLTEESNEIGLG